MELSSYSQPQPLKSEPLRETIASFRDASRKLVREWGFLRSVFAGSSLSPAAVHCLIEIGDARDDIASRSALHLRTELRVSQAELERIGAELINAGCITPDPDASTYSLTPTGSHTLDAVNAYAEDQVSRALAAVSPASVSDITTAFRVYTAALERARAAPTPESSRPGSPLTLTLAKPPPVLPPPPVQNSQRDIRIHAGYFPGLIAASMQMHMAYYHARIGWGLEFETGLSTALVSIVSRLENPVNHAWCAVEMLPSQTSDGQMGEERQKIIGTIFIDGEIASRPGTAQVRAFIVDESARGLGLGRKLVGAAMAFVREKGFKECRLETMRCLEAARRLYEAVGFVEVAEVNKVIWGKEVGEMVYVWRPEGV